MIPNFTAIWTSTLSEKENPSLGGTTKKYVGGSIKPGLLNFTHLASITLSTK